MPEAPADDLNDVSEARRKVAWTRRAEWERIVTGWMQVARFGRAKGLPYSPIFCGFGRVTGKPEVDVRPPGREVSMCV